VQSCSAPVPALDGVDAFFDFGNPVKSPKNRLLNWTALLIVCVTPTIRLNRFRGAILAAISRTTRFLPSSRDFDTGSGDEPNRAPWLARTTWSCGNMLLEISATAALSLKLNQPNHRTRHHRLKKMQQQLRMRTKRLSPNHKVNMRTFRCFPQVVQKTGPLPVCFLSSQYL